ncbi:MAG: hypothetical protein M1817_000947 [Caeruleum heppii]|nr:MAG: hypothetical protein M1817_000947 [Caeruleum heppii]
MVHYMAVPIVLSLLAAAVELAGATAFAAYEIQDRRLVFECDRDICDSCAGQQNGGQCSNTGSPPLAPRCTPEKLCNKPTMGGCRQDVMCREGSYRVAGDSAIRFIDIMNLNGPTIRLGSEWHTTSTPPSCRGAIWSTRKTGFQSVTSSDPMICVMIGSPRSYVPLPAVEADIAPSVAGSGPTTLTGSNQDASSIPNVSDIVLGNNPTNATGRINATDLTSLNSTDVASAGSPATNVTNRRGSGTGPVKFVPLPIPAGPDNVTVELGPNGEVIFDIASVCRRRIRTTPTPSMNKTDTTFRSSSEPTPESSGGSNRFEDGTEEAGVAEAGAAGAAAGLSAVDAAALGAAGVAAAGAGAVVGAAAKALDQEARNSSTFRVALSSSIARNISTQTAPVSQFLDSSQPASPSTSTPSTTTSSSSSPVLNPPADSDPLRQRNSTVPLPLTPFIFRSTAGAMVDSRTYSLLLTEAIGRRRAEGNPTVNVAFLAFRDNLQFSYTVAGNVSGAGTEALGPVLELLLAFGALKQPRERNGTVVDDGANKIIAEVALLRGNL